MYLAFNLVEFNVSDPGVAERWVQYVAKVKMLFKLNITDGTSQLTYLLLLAGQGIVKLHARYEKVDEHSAQDETKAFHEFADKLTTHFNPKSNRIFNVYNFGSLTFSTSFATFRTRTSNFKSESFTAAHHQNCEKEP